LKAVKRPIRDGDELVELFAAYDGSGPLMRWSANNQVGGEGNKFKRGAGTFISGGTQCNVRVPIDVGFSGFILLIYPVTNG